MTSIYRAKVSYSGGVTGPSVSTFHFALATIGDLAAIGTKLGDFYTELQPIMSSGCTPTLLPEVEEVEATTGVLVDVHAITGWSGVCTGSGDQLPYQTQGLIKWRTGVVTGTPSREILGKTFIPAPLESHSTGGLPTATYTTAANAAVAEMLTASAASLVIYSPKNATAALASSGSCWGKWASLRSRRD